MALCYLDREFCNSDCTNTGCWRNFTNEHRANADRWAKDILGIDYAPIAMRDMSDGCSEYKPKGDE